MDCMARARELIDIAHAADPTRTPEGRAAELVYADRMEAWVARLAPGTGPLLRLAARAQHLERWLVPRDTFPSGKAGYHAWRQSLYVKQSERARELLLQAGVPAADAARAVGWVAKADLKNDPEAQVLEDAACLVFLENELAAFLTAHAADSEEKLVGILQKTWRKMSPTARQFALKLDFPAEIAALIQRAVDA